MTLFWLLKEINEIDDCANYGIPAQTVYLNYHSTTTQLTSEKTLLDRTETNNF